MTNNTQLSAGEWWFDGMYYEGRNCFVKLRQGNEDEPNGIIIRTQSQPESYKIGHQVQDALNEVVNAGIDPTKVKEMYEGYEMINTELANKKPDLGFIQRLVLNILTTALIK